MADEGVAHCGQGELERCEVTRTSTSSAVWLTEVSWRPSGKGNNGDEGINFLEKRFLGWLEQIFEEIPENTTSASPKSWKRSHKICQALRKESEKAPGQEKKLSS